MRKMLKYDIVIISKEDYEALEVKNKATLYFIKEEGVDALSVEFNGKI